MVLTRPELIAALQNEVRILLHLAGKVDRDQLDYRPTPKQRSTLELLQYLSMMGPTMIEYARSRSTDPGPWMAAEEAASRRTFDQTVAAIAAHAETYERLLADLSDADFRTENHGPAGRATLGVSLVTGVLCGLAAYRTQLFLYLKASGREELNTSNLWAGIDAPAPV
jgi:hypothetical protein